MHTYLEELLQRMPIVLLSLVLLLFHFVFFSLGTALSWRAGDRGVHFIHSQPSSTWPIPEDLHRPSLSGPAAVWANLAHSQWAALIGVLRFQES